MDSTLLWVLGFVALYLLSDRYSKYTARRGARKSVEQWEALHRGGHEFVSVDPQHFPWLDLRFYDDARSRLEAQGFRFLGDVEDVTVTEQHPNMRTFIRVLCDERGEVCAGIYQVKLRGPMAVLQWVGVIPRRLRVLDLESELSDGRFLATSSSQGLDTTPISPGIDLERLPAGTDFATLVARQRERLRAALQASPGIRVCSVRSLNEALASQDRMQRLKNETVGDGEALVETIERQRGARFAKDLMIEEVRRESGTAFKTGSG